MSVAREEIIALLEQIRPDKEEQVLELLRCISNADDRKSEEKETLDLYLNHIREAAQRAGLDPDRLPKNGGWSGGSCGDTIEVTKDWESETARHRLSSIDIHGRRVILLERIEFDPEGRLRYEARVFSDDSDGIAEARIAVR